MFVVNIPRRKIYETMLELEDLLIDMNILLYSKDNFEKYKESFNQKILNLKKIYKKINSLFIFFLENKQFEKEEDFEKNLNYFMINGTERDQFLKKNKNLTKEFKEIIENLNIKLDLLTEIIDYEKTKQLFEDLDRYNSLIPKALELRRDFIK